MNSGYICKSSDELDNKIYQLAKEGNDDAVWILIDQYGASPHFAVQGAAEGRHRNLMMLLITKYDASIDYAIRGAALGNHPDNLDYVVLLWNCGASIDFAVQGAAKSGNKHLVRYFIGEGASIEFALHGAMEGGHHDLMYTLLIKVRAQEYFKSADASISEGHDNDAIDNYNEAIKLDPDYIEAYNSRGVTYHKQGKLIEAISDFTKAISINPQYKLANTNLLALMSDIQENLFHTINKLSSSEKISLLENCLDNKTALGRFIAEEKNLSINILTYLNILKQDILIEVSPDYAKTHLTSDNVNHVLGNLFLNTDNLNNITKPALFEIILTLPLENQIPLLYKCLTEGNPLGDRMWKSEFPYTGCSYNNKGSTLNNICLYLQNNDPDHFIWPTDPLKPSMVSVIANSIFKTDVNYDDESSDSDTIQNKVTASIYMDL